MRTKLGEIKLILSDHSGVLSNDIEPVRECNRRIIRDIAHQQMYDAQDWLARQETFDEMLRSFGIQIETPEEREELFKEYYKKVLSDGIMPTMYYGVKEALEAISQKGIPIAVVSAHPTEHLELEIIGYGIKDFFAKLYGSTTEAKAEALVIAYSDFSVCPSETVFIGDMTSDIQSGKNAGVHTIAVINGYHSLESLQEEQPEIMADSFQEAIKKLGIY